MTNSDPASLKRAAALRALDFVADGMKLGLGTGTTSEAFLDVLAPRVREGLKLSCVATSERTAEKARALGIPVFELDALAPLDLTVDGATKRTGRSRSSRAAVARICGRKWSPHRRAKWL